MPRGMVRAGMREDRTCTRDGLAGALLQLSFWKNGEKDATE